MTYTSTLTADWENLQTIPLNVGFGNGNIALSVIALLGRTGDFRAGLRRTAVDTVSIYWHFVDGIWVIIFSLVYLLGLVS